MGLADITTLGLKLIADFETGKYASLSHDLGDGFHKLGDLLTTFFGFQGTGDVADEKLLADFQKAGQECCTKARAKVFGSVSGFDPAKWISAFQQFLQTLAAIWQIFNPPTPVAAKA